MKISPRLRKRLFSTTAILLIATACTLWFRRNYHFTFDSHHLYERATFGQWITGWFGDFDRGPLTATLISAPAPDDSGLTESSYQWHLSRTRADSEMEAWIETPEGLFFVVTRLPASREFLLHSWGGAPWTEFDYQLTAHHVGNQREQITSPLEQIHASDRKAVSLVAWQPSRVEFQEGHWSSPLLGQRILLPGGEPIQDWVFQFEIEAEGTSPGDRLLANYVIQFDQPEQKWRIVSRDHHDMRGVDSWIDPAKQLEISLPAGFDLSD